MNPKFFNLATIFFIFSTSICYAQVKVINPAPQPTKAVAINTQSTVSKTTSLQVSLDSSKISESYLLGTRVAEAFTPSAACLDLPKNLQSCKPTICSYLQKWNGSEVHAYFRINGKKGNKCSFDIGRRRIQEAKQYLVYQCELDSKEVELLSPLWTRQLNGKPHVRKTYQCFKHEKTIKPDEPLPPTNLWVQEGPCVLEIDNVFYKDFIGLAQKKNECKEVRR